LLDCIPFTDGRFVVDAADVRSECQVPTLTPANLAQTKSLPTATSELHALLSLPALAGVPLLVLANKNDLDGALSVDDMIREMRLAQIGGRVVSVSTASVTAPPEFASFIPFSCRHTSSHITHIVVGN